MEASSPPLISSSNEETPKSSSLSSSTISSSFVIPSRKIITKDDLELFSKSETCQEVKKFIQQLSLAVRGLKLSHPVHISEVCQSLLDVLSSIDQVVTETPPEENPATRFGNPAFRLFYDRVQHKIPEWLAKFVPMKEAIPELSKYLEKCFGDRRRIDYGTGHEAHFLCLLYCFNQLHLVSEPDYPALVLRVFARYLELMRHIQSTYWLEPAGSHGVWGLDDYHSLPFLFGASQLVQHPYLTPRAIHDRALVQDLAREYLYLGCIDVIQSTSAVSLRWHAPMLDDISAVKTWAKIESGLHKLYAHEVLGKLPVMQHFLFGSMLPFANTRGDAVSDTDLDTSIDGNHLHVYAMGQEFPSCCGLRVPSVHAVRKKEGDKKTALKVLPFD